MWKYVIVVRIMKWELKKRGLFFEIISYIIRMRKKRCYLKYKIIINVSYYVIEEVW